MRRGVKKIKIKTWDHIRQRFGRINKGRKRSIQLNRIVDKKISVLRTTQFICVAGHMPLMV